MSIEPGHAPTTELKLATIIRRYERVKLVLMVTVLCLNVAIGSYLVGIARATKTIGVDNKTSLSILRCAVSPEVQVPKTDEGKREAFDRCVAHGGPSTAA